MPKKILGNYYVLNTVHRVSSAYMMKMKMQCVATLVEVVRGVVKMRNGKNIDWT